MNIPAITAPLFFDMFVRGYISDNLEYFEAPTAESALKHFRESAEAFGEDQMNPQQEERFLAQAERLFREGHFNRDEPEPESEAEEITYELLISEGECLDTALEGTCILYQYKGKEYVVLSDDSVMTREEDNTFDDPIFPY